MYDYLKQCFGTGEDGEPEKLSFDELCSKIAEHKDIKLANLAEGGYVGVDKFNAKETELAGVKEQLQNANTQIQSYKDMDIEGIKQSAKDWEAKYNSDTEELNKKLAEQERSHSVDMFLSDYKFTSKAAKAGVRAEFEKKNFPLENGSFLGAKDYMDGLMQDEDYKGAFVSENAENAGGVTGEKDKTPKPQFSDPNPQEAAPPKKMSLAEMMLKKNEHPESQIEFEK